MAQNNQQVFQNEIRHPLGKIGNHPIIAVAYPATIERLSSRCFRGKGVCKAGNFFRWDNFLDVIREFADDLKPFIEEHIERISAQPAGARPIPRRGSVEFKNEHPLGWSSTADLALYRREVLEHFDINNGAYGRRIRSNRILAPITDLITFVYEVKKRDNRTWLVIVHSVYPGKDVGDLKGNVSEREQVAFFDWFHPGEPIPSNVNSSKPLSAAERATLRPPARR
ncbi:MAG: hypothetical protein RL141_250 [Candidatus Parcubacteria bacterium]|jgi:hypothetical protein